MIINDIIYMLDFNMIQCNNNNYILEYKNYTIQIFNVDYSIYYHLYIDDHYIDNQDADEIYEKYFKAEIREKKLNKLLK